MKRTALAFFLTAANSWGQCVMCFRTAAAQNLARARLLNMGIFLLGLPPFAILAGFLILAWRRNRAFATADPPDLPGVLPDPTAGAAPV
jgi:hypothetical protein